MGWNLTSTELLTLDANALQQRLEAGLLSSVELVTCCLMQIENYDQQRAQLRPIIYVVPCERLLSRALQLDVERSSGHVRSRLQGIPMLVKVRNRLKYWSYYLIWSGQCRNWSKFGRYTSVGSLALKYSMALNPSPIINKGQVLMFHILSKLYLLVVTTAK